MRLSLSGSALLLSLFSCACLADSVERENSSETPTTKIEARHVVDKNGDRALPELAHNETSEEPQTWSEIWE